MIEENIGKSLFSRDSEKTSIDKVLCRRDVDDIRAIIKKPRLTREELLDVLYLISGAESKMLNYGAWDRYVILKFFVWVREFVKIAELLFDYKDFLYKNAHKCANCSAYKESEAEKGVDAVCECGNFKKTYTLTPRTVLFLSNCERMIEHNAKFLIDLYLNIGRTSLSIGATAFLESLKAKYEIVYPMMGQTTNIDDSKKGVNRVGG